MPISRPPSTSMRRATSLRHAPSSSSRARPALLGAAGATGAIAPRKLQCFSVACNDMPHLEFGDKIVLPAKVLLELQCFKVATPMLFHIRAFAAQEQDGQVHFTQYCSVQEFSAPDGQVFIPYWMMQNLHITEGSDVVITNVVNIPRGIYCRLQPEDTSFLDVAAEIGPKLLMESALRRYSVLSTNETILIDYGDKRFYVKVLELKPGPVVSLLGDVDLELDFAAPPQSDPKRPRSATEAGAVSVQTPVEKSHESLPGAVKSSTGGEDLVVPQGIGIGRRLADGACVAISDARVPPLTDTVAKKSAKLGSSSFRAVQQRSEASGSPNSVSMDRVAARADTDALAKDIRLAQGAFSSGGNRLGGQVASAPPPKHPEEGATVSNEKAQVCEMCLSEIAPANAALHAMRCARNPSYHKFECTVCHAHVLKGDRSIHLHCNQCIELLTSELDLTAHIDTVHAASNACADCGAKFTQAGLVEHQRNACPNALELCKLCGFKFKRRELVTHAAACSSRTEKCEVCQKYIKIVDVDAHLVACISDRESAPSSVTISSNNQLEEITTTSSSTGMECVYCAKCTFTGDRQLERHVKQECLVARSFRAPAICTNQVNDPAASTVRTLIQGKLRRREDVKLLSESASGVSFHVSRLQDRLDNQQAPRSRHRDPLIHTSAGDASTLASKRKLKPARPPAQLASLPTKPAQPQLHQLDGLFIGNTQPQPRQLQSNARTASTRKLQAIRRP